MPVAVTTESHVDTQPKQDHEMQNHEDSLEAGEVRENKDTPKQVVQAAEQQGEDKEEAKVQPP